MKPALSELSSSFHKNYEVYEKMLSIAKVYLLYKDSVAWQKMEILQHGKAIGGGHWVLIA